MRIVIEVDNKHSNRLAKVLGLAENAPNSEVKTALENHLAVIVRGFVRGEVLKEETAKINTGVMVPDSEITPSV